MSEVTLTDKTQLITDMLATVHLDPTGAKILHPPSPPVQVTTVSQDSESSLLFLLPKHLSAFENHVMQSLQPLFQTISDDGTRRLQVPGRGRAQLAQCQQLLDLAQRQRVPQVLLVGHHQDGHALVLGEPRNFVQLRLGLLHPLSVHRVHYEDDPIRAPRVRLPEGPQLLLPPDIPEMKSHRPGTAQSHFDLLCIKSLGGHGVNKLIEL